jgi:hypothetical protein
MREAKPGEVARALSFALIYQGRKRVHDADLLIADIVARRLVENLQQSGFVIMKKLPEPEATKPKTGSP